MDQVRDLQRKIQSDWKRLKDHVWPNEPCGDYFRLMDYVVAVAGTRLVPKNHRQERFQPVWKVYHWMCHFHTVYMISNAFAHRELQHDFVEFSWFIMIALEVIMAHVKDLVVAKTSENIQNAQNFINERADILFDVEYDSEARRKYFRKIQLICGGIAVVCINMFLMMSIPNGQINELFALPNTIPFSAIIYSFFRLTTSPAWPCKIVSSTALITSILDGMKTELQILAHELGRAVEHAQSDTLEQLPSSETPCSREYNEILFKNLRKYILQNIRHHVKLLEELENCKPFVELFFFVLYFHAMTLFGTYIFVILHAEFSIGSVMILMALTVYFLKCYFWCWIISSFQDVNEQIEVYVIKLITAIPYLKEHQSEYIGLRTKLMIMMIRTQSSAKFSCTGVAVISVELFGNLMNISYSVITFLLNM